MRRALFFALCSIALALVAGLHGCTAPGLAPIRTPLIMQRSSMQRSSVESAHLR
jgi:hypothetical protein